MIDGMNFDCPRAWTNGQAVYAENLEGLIAFHPVVPPSDKEIQVMTQHSARRIGRPAKRFGFAAPGNSAETESFPLR
jgi:hypothetical protein